MLAFTAALPLPRPAAKGRRRLSARAAHAPPRACAPRFRGDDDAPRRAFRAPPPEASTPNARVLAAVRESMDRLGVSEAEARRPAPPARRPVDISRVNPASALLGSAGAAVMFWAAWSVLQGTVAFYLAHPFESDFYVLVRINAVVRTVLVGMFALASGISGVTSLGLLLLFGRTGFAAVTGEFREREAEGKETYTAASTEGEREQAP
jgi:Protein of unknown function (DUF3082)